MQNIRRIFDAGVAAVQPDKWIREHVRPLPGGIQISDRFFPVLTGARLWITGAGKAAAAMALAVETQLGGVFPLEGLVVTKYAHALPLTQVRIMEAGHPVPDENSVAATRALQQLLQQVQPDDLVILLLSGGASALLADYPPGSSLQEVQTVFQLLLQSGANIEEMNTVRKHLSGIKGGQLARSVYPARLCSLILSDVPGDDLSVIGSGPGTGDPTTFTDALEVLKRYRLKVPPAILSHLEQGAAGIIPDTPVPGDQVFSKTVNFMTGTNRMALEAAAAKAAELGYHPHIITDQLQGEAREVATILAQYAIRWDGPVPACLVAGGETTVTIRGTGKGGRNQELALAAGIHLQEHAHITLLSGGTDGTDGPTDAAGAIVNAAVMENASRLRLNANDFLEQNDAWHFFSKAGGLLITGPTQTNVMDLILLLVEKK